MQDTPRTLQAKNKPKISFLVKQPESKVVPEQCFTTNYQNQTITSQLTTRRIQKETTQDQIKITYKENQELPEWRQRAQKN